jgi:hypothetical protein
MSRFLLSALPILRGAMLAWLLAGLADAMALSLGGGADLRAVAQGAVLLALAVGMLHEGAGNPPLQASFLWLALGAALPMFSALAPAAAIGGLLFLLPLRALGARLSGMLAVEENPAQQLGLHLAGAALGLAWAASQGLGLSGFFIAFGLSGLLTSRLPAPSLEIHEEDMSPPQRGISRFGRFALGAGLTWTFLLLTPAVRAFDASGAKQDAIALLCGLVFVGAGWWTLGTVAAHSPRRAVWAAVAAAAAGLLLPVLVSAIEVLSQPEAFDARLSAGFLRRWADAGAPRLPEEHALYLPWVLLGTLALPAVLAGIAVRSALGRHPVGPDDLAPLLAGAGAALVAFSLPLAAAGTVPWLGVAAMTALLLAAAAELIGSPSPVPARLGGGAVIVAAAILFARPVPAPVIAYPMQQPVPWLIAQDATGADLTVAGRKAQLRVVVRGGDTPDQHLASGRNLITPELDAPGLWVRDLDLAHSCVEGEVKRVLMAGAPHPASLRALASAGVEAATLALDPAIFGLLRRRDPAGYGLDLSHAPTLARARGRFDLVLLRSEAMWDEDQSLLRPWTATQSRRRLRPGGACVLAVDPAQLVPGILPSLLAAWEKVFARVDLLVEPDGLRGVRLLLVGRLEASDLPAELRPLALTPDWLKAIAGAGSISSLMAPLPRSHGRLSETAWRLVDELRSVRRAQAVLEELSNLAGATPPPSLMAFAALQYAAQEYSSHDTMIGHVDDAVEVSEPALTELLRLARAWPESVWLRATWADAGATLAAKREVALVEQFLLPLRVELGWRDPGITLPLARAALELLDEEGARALIEEVLVLEPANAAALELRRVLDGEAGLAPDAHQGHGHD